MANGKVIFSFIGCIALIGATSYLVIRHLKKKDKNTTIDKHVAPSFSMDATEPIKVEAETIEQPQRKEEERTKQDLMFEEACNEMVDKRVTHSMAMSEHKKEKMYNTACELCFNPKYKQDKIRMFNEAMKNKDFNLLQKMIFDWVVSESRD